MVSTHTMDIVKNLSKLVTHSVGIILLPLSHI